MTTLFAEDMWLTKKRLFHLHSITYQEVNFQSVQIEFLEYGGASLLFCLSLDIMQLVPVVYYVTSMG